MTCAGSGRRSGPRPSCSPTSATSCARRSCPSRATPSSSCAATCLADKARESLEEIVDAADRLEIVVQRLLDVAAQEASPREVRCDRVPVEPLLDAVVDRWKERVDAKHPITRSVPRQIPDLMGDRELLERCFDELIDNAIKFSPDGGAVSAQRQGVRERQRVEDRHLGPRPRHRYPPRPEGSHLRGLRPGRQLPDARLRRARARTGAGTAHRRRPQRRAEVRDRAGRGLPVLAHPAGGPAQAPLGPALMPRSPRPRPSRACRVGGAPAPSSSCGVACGDVGQRERGRPDHRQRPGRSRCAG